MSVAGCVVSPASCVAGSAASAIGDGVMSAAERFVAASTSWVFSELATALGRASAPGIVTQVAHGEFRRLLLVSPIVALCAMLVSILGGIRRGDTEGLLREAAMGAPLIIIAIGAAPSLALITLRVVDGLCQVAAPSSSSVVAGVAARLALIPVGAPGFGVLLLDLAAVLGALALWFELVIRGALLALLLALSPVVVAAALWRPARRLAVRLAETFVAAALAKFVIVVALSMGATAASTGDVMVTITGIAVVLLSVLAPFALLRVIPLLEMSAIHAVGGLRQAATNRAVRAGRAAASLAGNLPVGEPMPTPPSEDLGFDDWPASPAPDLPDPDAPRGDPPIGTPTIRTGHAVLRRDHLGPVIGWHFDE